MAGPVTGGAAAVCAARRMAVGRVDGLFSVVSAAAATTAAVGSAGPADNKAASSCKAGAIGGGDGC